MQLVRIDEAADARLQPYREIGDAAGLRARGLFVAEGRRIVGDLAVTEDPPLESVLVTPAALARLRDRLNCLPGRVPVFVVPLTVVRELTGFNIHRGCLALGRRPGQDAAAAAADSAIAAGCRLLVLERVVDADNVGSLFRSARAFGVDAVLLSPGCCDPFYRKSIQVSSGAVLSVPFAVVDPWPGALSRLADAGYAVVALTPSSDATPIDSMPRDLARVAILVGTEGDGLSRDALAAAHRAVRIPMSPDIDSVNVAAAAAIALHWWRAPGTTGI